MALEHSHHLSAATQGDPISVAQGGGNILVHTVPGGWTDRIKLHVANVAGATASTVSILVNEVSALSIVMSAGSVYEFEVAAEARTIHVSATGGDTAVLVTGTIHRGGLAPKYG